MHTHSLLSYSESSSDGTFSKREKEVILALQAKGPLTDRQVMAALCFEDMNAVRPRLSELLKKGVIEECGNIKDGWTGKKVRLVRLVHKEQQIALL